MPRTFADTRQNWSALAPDVILAHGASTVGPLLQATRTVPIVFPIAGDPVGAGFVESLARPGGNATGFTEYRIQHGRRNGWSCSRRSRRASREWRCFGIATQGLPESVSLPPSSLSAPRCGVEVTPDQYARCRRDRAGRGGFCALAERRSDRDRRTAAPRVIAI